MGSQSPNPGLHERERPQRQSRPAGLFQSTHPENLQKHHKKMIGWDEILHPDLPKDAVIQSWRGPASLADAARKGYNGILSAGYYIDLIFPASQHYLADPIPPDSALTVEEAKHILGGEATMWG